MRLCEIEGRWRGDGGEMRPSAPAPTRWRRRRAIRSALPSRRHGPSRAGCTRSLQARDRRPPPRLAPLRRSRAASPWHAPRGCRAAARRRRRRRPAALATGGRPCVSRGRGAGQAGRPAVRAACACVRRAARARCATCVEHKVAQSSATWRSGDFVQRQSVLQAIPGFGQPQPTRRFGRPYRP